MKKILSALLALTMLLALTACGGNGGGTTSGGGGDSTNVEPLEFSVMSNGKPNITTTGE